MQSERQTRHAEHTFLSPALAVLKEAQVPLTIDEITDRALQRGLLTTTGKTPRRSMAACLYMASKISPDVPVERVFEPGSRRARRGSVRWRLRSGASGQQAKQTGE
jgi:HB1, ASXL, restriction endonuclease HTH domain